MERKLKTTITIFFILIISFIFFTFISEYINMSRLKIEYPNLSNKAYDYRKDSLKVWAINLILKFLIPLLFLTTKTSYRIRIWAETGKKSLFLTGLIYGIIFFLINFLINLPLNYYSSFYLKHKYGLSNQSVLRWLEVNLKGFLLNDLAISLFIWVPYYIINRSPRTWWLYIGLMSIPVAIFLNFISPMFIDPLFNKYTSIENDKLGQEIIQLLHKADIKDAKIYQVDKSRDTKEMNAYMTGVFNSKRIVLWDTTINNLEEREVLSVTAHEIGHYVKGHIWKGIFLSSIFTILLMYLIYKTSNWILYLSDGTFGFRKIYDIASIPLILLVLNFYTFIGLPFTNYVSRYMEKEADNVEMQLTEDKEAAISTMTKLYEESLGLPRTSKIFKIWYHSHPTMEERINFFKEYPL